MPSAASSVLHGGHFEGRIALRPSRPAGFAKTLNLFRHRRVYRSPVGLYVDGDHEHQLSSERTASASEIVKDQLLDLPRAIGNRELRHGNNGKGVAAKGDVVTALWAVFRA